MIIRVDLNIDSPENNLRLTSLVPTLTLILEKKPRSLVLLSHRGRPEKPVVTLSLKIIVDALHSSGIDASFAPTVNDARSMQEKHGGVIVLENLRFFPGEKARDLNFAKELRQLGSWYINDAWASMHTTDTSIALLPTLFDQEHKTCGLLVEKEVNSLSRFMHEAQHPTLLFLGGGKVTEKTALIPGLETVMDTIALGPLISLTGVNPQQYKRRIVLPVDYLVKTPRGRISNQRADQISTQEAVITIGAQTLEQYQHLASHAKTIVYNGFMGFTNDPSSLTSFKDLMNKIQQESKLLICGGDSVVAAQATGTLSRATLVSTGGGATLSFLARKELPGLKALGFLT